MGRLATYTGVLSIAWSIYIYMTLMLDGWMRVDMIKYALCIIYVESNTRNGKGKVKWCGCNKLMHHAIMHVLAKRYSKHLVLLILQ